MEIKVGMRVKYNGKRPPDYNNGKVGIITEIRKRITTADTLEVACDDGSMLSAYEVELEVINNLNNTMKITNLVKKILDKDTRKLVEAGFINGDLALTDEGVQELLGILFLEKKEELVQIAEEKNEENNKKN